MSERQKMISTADLIRRGATLLNEACPRCGGVQIRFRGRVYCVNEDDLSSILTPQPEARPRQVTADTAIAQPVANSSQTSSFNKASENLDLHRLLEEKLSAVSKQLEGSQDFDQQAKLLELISKYLETLEKLKRSSL